MRQCLGLWLVAFAVFTLFLCQAAAGTSGSRASGSVWHDHFSFVTEFFSDFFLPRPEQERRSKASKAPVLSAPGLGLSTDPAAGTANP